VNVVGLKNTAKVGLVRGACAQPLDRRLLVAESFKEGIREAFGLKRLIRQLRNRFFYLDGVQLFSPPSVINFNSCDVTTTCTMFARFLSAGLYCSMGRVFRSWCF
jgi:hypothetical protein